MDASRQKLLTEQSLDITDYISKEKKLQQIQSIRFENVIDANLKGFVGRRRAIEAAEFKRVPKFQFGGPSRVRLGPLIAIVDLQRIEEIAK